MTYPQTTTEGRFEMPPVNLTNPKPERDPEAVRVGEWLEQKRFQRGWDRATVARVTREFGFEWKRDYYSKIASGERPIRKSSEDAREALRLAYEIPGDEWFQNTGCKPVTDVINNKNPLILSSLTEAAKYHLTEKTECAVADTDFKNAADLWDWHAFRAVLLISSHIPSDISVYQHRDGTVFISNTSIQNQTIVTIRHTRAEGGYKDLKVQDLEVIFNVIGVYTRNLGQQ